MMLTIVAIVFSIVSSVNIYLNIGMDAIAWVFTIAIICGVISKSFHYKAIKEKK